MTKTIPEIHIYYKESELIEKSGIGTSIRHQTAVIRLLEEKYHLVNLNEKDFHSSDIVHINTVFPDSVRAALYAKMHGIKVIFYAHSTKEDFMNSFKNSNLYAPFFKLWIIFCYNLGDVIVTPTEYSRKILKGYGIKKPIVAISNGIDTNYWKKDESKTKKDRDAYWGKYGIASDRKVIMSVGHFMVRKGLTDFIRLAAKNPDKTFIWYGETRSSLVTDRIKRAIASAPENLIFAGHVSPDELRNAYQFCDLFLFMSYEETEGLVVLEAMSCKAPVIVRNIPVYNGWLVNKKNAFLFNSNRDLNHLMNYVLTHDTSSVTDNARKTAEERSIERIGRKLYTVYKRLKQLTH